MAPVEDRHKTTFRSSSVTGTGSIATSTERATGCHELITAWLLHSTVFTPRP